MAGKIILAQLAVAPAAPSASYSQFYSLTTNKGYIMHPDGVARLLVAEDGSGDATLTRNLLLAAGSKVAYSAAATTTYMTPENNVTGAEIRAPGTITLTIGTTALTTINSTGLGIFTTPSYALDVFKSSSGADVRARVWNSSNTASSSATAFIGVAGGTAADPTVLFEIGGALDWAAGIDNSTGDAFKISQAGTLGTNDYLTIDTSGSTLLGNTGSNGSGNGIINVVSGFTSTTLRANIVARFASNASGADTTLNLTDAVTNNGYISLKGGQLYFNSTSDTSNFSGRIVMGGVPGSDYAAAVFTVHTAASENLFVSSDAGGVRLISGSDGLAAYKDIDIEGSVVHINDASAGVVLIGTSTNFATTVALGIKNTSSSGSRTVSIHNPATSGDNNFVNFGTEASYTERGSITYNRGGGLIAYNTTSGADLKNIFGDADPAISLGVLRSARMRSYAWKDDPTQKRQIGPIADELREVMTGSVTGGRFVKERRVEERSVIVDGQVFSCKVTTEVDGTGPLLIDRTAFVNHLVVGWQQHDTRLDTIEAALQKANLI